MPAGMTLDDKATLVALETIVEALLIEMAHGPGREALSRVFDNAATLCSAQIFAGDEAEEVATMAEQFIADLRARLAGPASRSS